jgi:hypothetical protein
MVFAPKLFDLLSTSSPRGGTRLHKSELLERIAVLERQVARDQGGRRRNRHSEDAKPPPFGKASLD